MIKLIGTDKRPVFYISPEMKFTENKIEYAQISDNGLWVEFYSSCDDGGCILEFEFPIIMVHSMEKTFMDNSD